MNRIPFRPKHPERVCWGCEKYCPADDMTCGNGSERTPHPIELFGEDFQEWGKPLADRVQEALREVIDPELGLNIVDLGLVYDVRIDEPHVHVDLTMTTPACPLGEHIAIDAETRILEIAGVGSVDVELVWEPPWSPERMSPAARLALGLRK